MAHVEIRLVEPTPVPSRVGSLGASQTAPLSNLLTTSAHIPPPLDELDERDSANTSPSPTSPQPTKRRGKFFFQQSSPSKGSGSESSPVAPAPGPSAPPPPHGTTTASASAAAVDSLAAVTTSAAPPPTAARQARRSSGSSTGAAKKKRHVSLSTMKGKFMAEKRKAKAAIEAREAREEDGGWEDEDEEEEGWSSGEDETASLTASPKEAPPPPAPTPLRKMSKRQREQAEAERAKIEAELEAQRKREMFAKQAIFGNQSGLLKQELQRGASMVDLTLRPSTTQKDLTEFRSVPAGPSILRSKSAVAIPVQTGVSVTIRSQGSGSGLNDSPSEQHYQPSSQEQTRSGSGEGNGKGKQGQAQSSSRTRLQQSDYLESTDEDSDDYLATSTTRRKLEALAAKRDKSAVQPIPVGSPTTDRRAMITREMSESLRKSESLWNQALTHADIDDVDIILERQKSSTNLVRFRPDQVPPATRPSVLGGGFLRPLTRVGNASTTSLNRTQSTTNFDTSPTSPAPPMTRSNTEGGGGISPVDAAVINKRAELQRRSETMDTSYRMHGW